MILSEQSGFYIAQIFKGDVLENVNVRRGPSQSSFLA